MMVTLTGAAVSDALDNAQVVSGVGGQYNFVAMAHDLDGARSVIALTATREKAGMVFSNIVWNYGHVTIPRHLRDVVVTEYGAADLRGASDRDVIAALLNIADSRFQQGLLAQAIAAGKIEPDYQIPDEFRANTPGRIRSTLLGTGNAAWFPHFPWRTEMTPEEASLAVALGYLKAKAGGWRSILRLLKTPLPAGTGQRFAAELERMGLNRTKNWRQRVERRLLLLALVEVHATGRPLTLPQRQATAGSSPPPTGARPGTNGTRFTDHA
jgi:hypothetical protein